MNKENKKFSNLNKLSKKKFDAVEFKHQLQKNLQKKSKAKNLKEYMEYINKTALKSPLFRKRSEKI